MVIGVVLTLGFLVLLVAFHAPVAAAIGVVTNLLATGAALIAKWIFQDGHLAGLLGFELQGFLDAWAPVFFFAMIFAISMDYTVFLLSSAKERWDAEGDARKAMVGGLADSGRVIFAAGAVMVTVFFTFALSGPLPPKEMGVVLGIAVLLDTFVVRLVLVPVLLRLAGASAWHVPRWADRILPDVRVGESPSDAAACQPPPSVSSGRVDPETMRCAPDFRSVAVARSGLAVGLICAPTGRSRWRSSTSSRAPPRCARHRPTRRCARCRSSSSHTPGPSRTRSGYRPNFRSRRWRPRLRTTGHAGEAVPEAPARDRCQEHALHPARSAHAGHGCDSPGGQEGPQAMNTAVNCHG